MLIHGWTIASSSPQAQLDQHVFHAVRAEDPHQVVLQRQVELGPALVALAARAAAQLVVDAPALVALRSDDVEAARRLRLFAEGGDLGPDGGLPHGALGAFGHVLQLVFEAHVDIAAELDIGAAAGHVRRHGDRARHARLGDDIGLLLVESRVEHGEELGGLALARRLVELLQRLGLRHVEQRVAALHQEIGELLGFLDGRCADQHRLHLGVGFGDLADDGLQLLLVGAVDLVMLVDAQDRLVGRNLDHFELVDLGEFIGLGRRRAGHAGELLVEAEIVLEGDRGERHVFRLDLDALLRLERLVLALGEAASRHHAAGELVDDDDLVVADDVILVELEELVGPQRLVEVMDDRDVMRVVERPLAHDAHGREQVLDMLVARLGEVHRALLLVEFEIFRGELRDDLVDRVVKLGLVIRRTGNDQRRARLVDQDRIHLVDDREIVAALGHLPQLVFHVVAEIVEAELVVGAIGDIGGVALRALAVVEAVDDDAGGESEETVDAPHPFRVAAGEVVVDGDDVDALALDRV